MSAGAPGALTKRPEKNLTTKFEKNLSGGYNWTVMRTSERMKYIAAFEEVSTKGNTIPFAKFLSSKVEHWTGTVRAIRESNGTST